MFGTEVLLLSVTFPFDINTHKEHIVKTAVFDNTVLTFPEVLNNTPQKHMLKWRSVP